MTSKSGEKYYRTPLGSAGEISHGRDSTVLLLCVYPVVSLLLDVAFRAPLATEGTAHYLLSKDCYLVPFLLGNPSTSVHLKSPATHHVRFDASNLRSLGLLP